MKLIGKFLPLVFAFSLGAQTSAPPADSWQPLSFLQGTWQAKTGEGFGGEGHGNLHVREGTQGPCAGAA